MYENNKDKKYGVHYTRWIMSWVRMGGRLSRNGEGAGEFKSWLETYKLEEDDIANIMWLVDCGKTELEIGARKFLEDENKVKA